MKTKCPYCDGILESGEAKIHGSMVGFLLVGLSYQNLYFKSESGNETAVLASHESTPAMKCNTCGVVTLNLNSPTVIIRDTLIELLTLCCYKELRDNVQKSNPEMDVESAIIEKWREIYLPDNESFKTLFTGEELSSLKQFNQSINDQNWSKIESLSGEIIESLNR